MGDAPRDAMGDADTMDGQLPVARGAPTGPADPDVVAAVPGPERVAGAAGARDYAELRAVDRDHYVIDHEIAKGGMGRVLEARDRRLGRPVAIKVLLPKNRDDARRFEREVRITARLQHPSIIHIYEAGVWPGGEPFFAMTRVVGRSLDKVVAERPTLEARADLLRNAIAVADALAYAHSKNVIHRDLKPANVLIGEFGETVVIDWGLAKDLAAPGGDPKDTVRMEALLGSASETASGSVVGTPAYMPPEQAHAESVDQRADVYALGALLYHVLVGAAPYTGTSSADVLEQVKTRAPVPIREREPGAPADLIAIVEQAMARAPADRYAHAGELANDLKRFETGQLVAARRYTPSQLVRRWLRRYRVVIGAAAAALVGLAIVAAISVERIVTERDRAETQQHVAEHQRTALLEERGRTELQAGRAGPALAYLAGAAHDGAMGGARAFLVAEAMRPFAAELANRPSNARTVALAASSDGATIATAGADDVRTWTADGAPLARFAHTGATRALAFDPTGRWLAAAGEDGSARVWPRGGGEPRVLPGHTGAIAALAWSPDGTRLVTAGTDGIAIVRDVDTGAEIARSTCHTAPLTSAQFSPDGTRVVTASEDMTACVWNARTQEIISLLRGHTAAVNSARWTSDGKRVVTASDDGTARVWNPDRGTPVVAQMNVGGAVTVAVPSHDGGRVLTAGTDRVGRVWELPADGSPPRTAHVIAPLLGHTDAIVDAVFSSDDERIATAGSDRVARVWATATGQAIGSFEHADAVRAVAFAAGGHRLVTASRDGTTRIWDLARVAARVSHDHDGSPVHAIAVAPDRTLAVGTDDSRVTLWRGATSRVLLGHRGRVYAVAFAPDGRRLVSGGEDEQSIVWDPASGAQVGALGPHHRVHAIAFAPDGTLVATAEDDGVRLWSASTGALVRALPSGGPRMTAVAIHGDLVVGTRADGALLAWSTRTSEAPVRIAAEGPVSAVAFAPDGGRLVAAGDGFANVSAVADGRVAARPELALDGPTGTVVDAAVSRDGTLVFTASTDGVARVWDAAKGKLLGARSVHGAASALALAPDDTLWVASEDGSVTGWDVHEATEHASELDAFIALHVPWRLGDDDVVRRYERGGSDD